MRTLGRAVAVLAIASVVGSGLPAVAKAAPDLDPRIVGGEVASIEDAPWQVALLRADRTNPYQAQFCGGSVIDERWIVTAAHCVDTIESPTQVQVAPGVSTLPDSDSAPVTRYEVSRILIHPEWNANTNFADVALLQLSESLPLDGVTIAPISLPTFGSWPALGATALITGWGNTSAGDTAAYPTTLRKADVAILAGPGSPDCGDYPQGDYDSSVMLCAGTATEPYIDSCQGDSGGPLAIQRDGQWWLAGITSWGKGCAQPGYPGIYTRVTTFTDWIRAAQAPGSTGSITVTATGDDQMLCAYVYDADVDAEPIATRCGDAASTITVPDVFPGTYYVKTVFESIYAADTWYASSGAALKREEASVATVSAARTTRISTTSRAATAMTFGVPAEASSLWGDLCVEVWSISAEVWTSGCLRYEATSVRVLSIPASSEGFTIYVNDNSGTYASFYYTGAGQSGSASDEQALNVSSPANSTTAYTLTLTPAARISGTVETTPGYEGDARVAIYVPGVQAPATSIRVQEDGSFSAWWLPPGTYFVEAFDRQGIHKPQWWESATSRDAATPIALSAGSSVSGVTMTLTAAGSITGTVTGPDGKAISADSEVEVVLYRDDEVLGSAPISGDTYTLTELDPGEYKIEFVDLAGVYLDEFYDGAMDLAGAQPVTVNPLQVTSGIDAVLSPARSLTISASRTGRGFRSQIVIQGTSAGLAGSRVTPWIKVGRAKKFVAARTVTVRADGTFTWKYRTVKRASIYVTVGSVRSNTVIVPAWG